MAWVTTFVYMKVQWVFLGDLILTILVCKKTWFFPMVTTSKSCRIHLTFLRSVLVPIEILIRYIVVVLEPGFYQDGEFGIRLENLVRVVPAHPQQKFKDLQFLTFENLTYVPIQQKMVIPEMLTKEEVRSR